MKPGYKTTEFYVTLAGILVSLLMVAGVIGEGERDTWQEMLANVLPGAGAIVMYIWSRTRVKAGE